MKSITQIKKGCGKKEYCEEFNCDITCGDTYNGEIKICDKCKKKIEGFLLGLDFTIKKIKVGCKSNMSDGVKCGDKKKKGFGEEGLNEFFGDTSWKVWGGGNEELVNIYIENIKKVKSDAVIKKIKIHSEKHGFCYFLLFITSKTKGGNPWLKGIDKAKEEIESNSDKSVEMALDIIKKRQATLPS